MKKDEEAKMKKEKAKMKKEEEKEKMKKEKAKMKKEEEKEKRKKKRKIPHERADPKKPRLDLDLQSKDFQEEDIPHEIRDFYRDNWEAIRSHFHEGKRESMYNIKWELGLPEWDDKLREIFGRQQKRFKINFSHSFVLHHRDNDKYCFFHASKNNARVFDVPRLINNPTDFERFLQDFHDTDVLGHAKQHRPDSKWTVRDIAATSFYINPLPDFPIGCCDHALPDFIKNNPAINALEKDEHNNFSYEDSLCFFRCLALHRGATRHQLQRDTRVLFDQWKGHAEVSEDFRGMTLSQLKNAEDLFRVNVDVFEYDESQSPPCLVPS
ncbi:hypothetical protein ACOMHN_029906 [Nucella lapillus]